MVAKGYALGLLGEMQQAIDGFECRVFRKLREKAGGAWEADALPTELFPLWVLCNWMIPDGARKSPQFPPAPGSDALVRESGRHGALSEMFR